jgi:hypothetical protein
VLLGDVIVSPPDPLPQAVPVLVRTPPELNVAQPALDTDEFVIPAAEIAPLKVAPVSRA